MRVDTKKLALIGLFAALSFAVVATIRIPVVMFLKYEPKDSIIAIGGFIFGPLAAFMISLVASLVEMVTISDTGFIGLIMNVLSTCTFVCTAAFIYKRKHTQAGAVIGLVSGAVLMTAVMLLWNYLITPIYMKYPRADVAKMLIPVFLPFNLLKSAANSAITMLLYKPVVTALRKSRLLPEDENARGGKFSAGAALISALIIVTCVMVILVFRGKI